jgi:hypothetical protein
MTIDQSWHQRSTLQIDVLRPSRIHTGWPLLHGLDPIALYDDRLVWDKGSVLGVEHGRVRKNERTFARLFGHGCLS